MREIDLVIVRPPLPLSCYVGDVALRTAAYRMYELVMWADAVEYRGLRLSSLEPLVALSVENEVRRRNESR